MSAVNQVVSSYGGSTTSPLLTNLISYWKMDEASGNALDANGTNTLTDNNAVGAGTGIILGARDFEESSSQFLSHTDNASLSTGDIDFTFALWIKLESKTAYRMALTQLSATSYGYRIYYDQLNDKLSFDVGNGATTIIGTAMANTLGSPATGTWYYIVVWHDSVANTVNIQVNNGTVDSFATTGAAGDSSALFCIGKEDISGGGGELYFDGLIDEVGFWKRTLTSGERTSLYNSGAGLAYPF